MKAIGVEIVTSGMRKLPSLSKDYLFTEKFKKIIAHNSLLPEPLYRIASLPLHQSP
jgi:hypothetical protein